MKKIAGVVLVILGIIMFSHAIWWSPLNFFVPHDTNSEKHFPINDVHTIQLDVTSEELQILPTDEDKMKVVATGRDLNHVNFNVDRNGNKVKINLKPKWYSLSDTNELNLIIYIPKDKLVDINAIARSRVVEIGEAKGSKWDMANLNAEVTSGTFNLHNLKLGSFIYNGTSTDVIMDRVQAGKAIMDTFSGNMNISHFIGSLNIASTSGNVRIQIDKLVGDIHTEMISGNLNMYLPVSSSFMLNAQLQSGQFTSKYPLEVNRPSSTISTARAGKGEYKIKTEIANGDFILY